MNLIDHRTHSDEMALPTKNNIHLPLLKVLDEAGGELSARDAMQKVKGYFPELTPDDLASLIDSGENRLNNRIRWAKVDLVLESEVDGSKPGSWRITEKGKEHLKKEWATWKPRYVYQTAPLSTTSAIVTTTQQNEVTDPLELLEQARKEIVKRVEAEVLDRLRNVEPSTFENIIAQLLEKLEYGSLSNGTIKVLGRSGDGGIDGECAMDRLGLYKAKFQAKRWGDGHSVSSKELRDFIGALTTERVEQGIFVTTSSFTQDARETAIKSGKVKLIDGEELAKITVEAGLGVRRTTLDIPKIDEEYFAGL